MQELIESIDLGGNHEAKVCATAHGEVWMMVSERFERGNGWGGELSAEKARALAALLLKHADRAEGKTS